MTVTAQAEAAPAFVAHKPPGVSGTEGVRLVRGGESERSAEVDCSENEEIASLVTGSPPRRDTELRVAALLTEKFNRDGATWSYPLRLDPQRSKTGTQEDGVDCKSTDNNGNVLLIQVTAPETSRQRELAQKGSSRLEAPDAGGLVEAVLTAVRKKQTVAGRDKITLALDATDFPDFAVRSVTNAICSRQDDVARAGYRSVWMVGPAVDLVVQLDA